MFVMGCTVAFDNEILHLTAPWRITGAQVGKFVQCARITAPDNILMAV